MRQPLAGGKGGTLARLYQAGYPVPEGFVLLPAAFAGDRLTAEAWAEVKRLLAGMRRAGKSMAAFAVRSSTLSEDSSQASFAGEFETVLDVHTEEVIQAAIHAVRRSRHSERVHAYSEAKWLDAAHEMAVVVQRLIRADLSGVLFTADPISGSHMQMMGNFVYGFGEELVSGKTEPYTFTLARPRGGYDGPPELKRFASRIFRLAVRLEVDLGCPQDIEWAIAGRRLYLLQSRPITTLVGTNLATGEWNDSLTGDYLWTNANLTEAVPDVMTPSTWSMTRILHFETTSAVMPRSLPLSGNICGRPYVNVSLALSIYRLMSMKPEDANRRVEELFGRLPEGLEIPVPPIVTLSDFLRLVPANIRREIQFRRRIKRMPEFIAEAPAQCKRLRQRIRRVQAKPELAALWQEEVKPYLYHAFYMLRGSMKWFDEPAAALRHDLAELVGKADAHALLSNLSDEAAPLASLGPVLGVVRVASPPPLIRGRFDPFEWAADPDRRSDLFDSHAPVATRRSDVLTGFAGAAGRVEGVVRRLHSAEEGDQLQQGEILVTTTTNVGWTPLFPRAAAIVTDVGAPLSHAAIVARELGIPAVVGCGNATMRLRSGDRVRVDGGQGTVELLERNDYPLDQC